MQEDQQSIRALFAAWHAATAAGDLSTLLGLMAEDVVFLLAGQTPMRGREAFAAAFRAGLQSYRVESTGEVEEIQIAGDFAYCWSHLSVTVTPLQGGSPKRHAGYALTILRKKPDGNWIVARDANMLTAEHSTSA